MARTRFSEKLRNRRQTRAFERALDSASPTVRRELVAMAQRQNYTR